MSQASPSPSPLDDARTGLNVLTFVMTVWAVSLEVFMHRRVGSHYPGLSGLGVLVFVPAYGCLWPGHDPRPLLVFLGLFLFFCGWVRFWSRVLAARDPQPVHSRYVGDSMFSVFFPGLSERCLKLVIEPLYAGFVGLVLCLVNSPSGTYLLGGAVCLVAQQLLELASSRHQATAMHDALIEQHVLMEQFRRLRRDDQ